MTIMDKSKNRKISFPSESGLSSDIPHTWIRILAMIEDRLRRKEKLLWAGEDQRDMSNSGFKGRPLYRLSKQARSSEQLHGCVEIKGCCQPRRHRPAVLDPTRLHARVFNYVKANRWRPGSTCVGVLIESELQPRLCLEFG